jgi:hypothetical protein
MRFRLNDSKVQAADYLSITVPARENRTVPCLLSLPVQEITEEDGWPDGMIEPVEQFPI